MCLHLINVERLFLNLHLYIVCLKNTSVALYTQLSTCFGETNKLWENESDGLNEITDLAVSLKQYMPLSQ